MGKKKQEEPKKTGRPKWIPSELDIEKVEALAARGLTKEQIAHSLGVSYDTLNERSKEFPEFFEAIKVGEAKGISVVANALFESAKKGNTAAQIFFLKCRAQWKETVVLDGSLNLRHESALKELE